MARQASNNLNKFKGLEDSPAIQGIERIYKANEEAHQKRVAEALEQQQNGQGTAEITPVPQTDVPSHSPVPPVSSAPISTPEPAPAKKTGKKTQNGITIYVPMEYYERIVMMKMRTGLPIKDLALQAVIEFLDRNK